MFRVVAVIPQDGKMEGWLLMKPSGRCASPSDGSCWKNKGLFMRADRLRVWRLGDNDIIVVLVRITTAAATPSPEAFWFFTF